MLKAAEQVKKLDAEVLDMAELNSMSEALCQMKKDEIAVWNEKFKIYEHVDLEKYKNLSLENNVSQKKLKIAVEELSKEKRRSLERLEVCKEKDD